MARETRGGSNQVSVYTSTANVAASVVPTVKRTGLPGNWQYSGCLACVYIRIYSMPLLMIYSTISEPVSSHVFPYRFILQKKNSAQNCLSRCSAFGYPAAGMEYGDECCV